MRRLTDEGVRERRRRRVSCFYENNVGPFYQGFLSFRSPAVSQSETDLRPKK